MLSAPVKESSIELVAAEIIVQMFKFGVYNLFGFGDHLFSVLYQFTVNTFEIKMLKLHNGNDMKLSENNEIYC